MQKLIDSNHNIPLEVTATFLESCVMSAPNSKLLKQRSAIVGESENKMYSTTISQDEENSIEMTNQTNTILKTYFEKFDQIFQVKFFGVNILEI